MRLIPTGYERRRSESPEYLEGQNGCLRQRAGMSPEHDPRAAPSRD
jgi:hypothetical protein